jgi:hypothetical protein
MRRRRALARWAILAVAVAVASLSRRCRVARIFGRVPGNSGRMCEPSDSSRMIARMSDPRHPIFLSYRQSNAVTGRRDPGRRENWQRPGAPPSRR